jgi:hypothetical protein
MRGVFNLPDSTQLLSPVQIPRGFTRRVIEGEIVEDLGARIVAAQAEMAKGRDLILLEGTGHAGVGAVIGLSNADVAALLGAPVIIVSEGGIGRPIDEIVLNAALFAARGVEVAGAIVNKVNLEMEPQLPQLLERGLARHRIPLLGILPYRQILSNPTLAIIEDGLQGETLWPGRDMDVIIGRVSVAAMQPEHVMERIGADALVVVPGDREDVLEVLAGLWLNGGELDGVRLVSRKTIELMTADHLPAGTAMGADMARFEALLPGPEMGQGFGLGFAVRNDAGRSPLHGSPGDYFWGGAFGTYFWIDPKEKLFAILMMQSPAARLPYRYLMRELVYQSIID